MLKGFTHARLACGCRITFREGVEGSPVTVVVDEKSPALSHAAARARFAALRLPRSAAPVDTALACPKRKSTRKRARLSSPFCHPHSPLFLYRCSGPCRRRRCSSSSFPFPWALVALWAVSHFLRAIGLTLAFHRYFAHRAFQMNRAARFVWTFVGTAAMQKGPLWWAGHHVNHHRFADREGDPHSPLVSGVLLRARRLVPERRQARPPRADESGHSRFLEGAGDRVARPLLLRARRCCWRLRCTSSAACPGWCGASVCRP